MEQGYLTNGAQRQYVIVGTYHSKAMKSVCAESANPAVCVQTTAYVQYLVPYYALCEWRAMRLRLGRDLLVAAALVASTPPDDGVASTIHSKLACEYRPVNKHDSTRRRASVVTHSCRHAA